MNTLSSISNDTIMFIIKEAAERFSELRRIRNIFWEHQYRLKHLQDIASTKQEMIIDWNNACTFISSKILHSDDIQLSQIDSRTYPILEEVWLKDIKLLKAYYIWEHSDTGCKDRNYYNACNIIRQMLLEKEKLHASLFESVRTYLEKNYLTNGKINEIKSAGAKTLIARKAQRIWQMAGHSDHENNWYRAKKYVTMFYNNIILAIIDSNVENILSVLRAFEFSKSPENRYLIINGFEAAIAIYFLDKEILKGLSNRPEWQAVL